MKRNKLLWHTFAALCLAACSSNPVTDHYYSLVLAADDGEIATRSEAAQKRLIVGPIALPAYLDQRNLTLQTGSSQIQVANHHFWAEPLDEAIAKVLVRDLSGLVRDTAVDRESGRWTSADACYLRIEFDRFHATNTSQVVGSGRYWLTKKGESGVKKEFDVTRTLSVDGYAHAVDSLRVVLNTLAGNVADTLENQATCTG